MNIPDEVNAILRELYALRQFGMKPGLETMTVLAQCLGQPERELRFLHIAGTNGKGSTAAILEALLRTAGHRTGLYTSPHLVWFGERIRINNVPLSPSQVAACYQEILPALRETERITGQRPTFFETATALALHAFRQEQCDWVVWETGMGGRLDATNIVTPEISIITRIDFDHMRWLGDTLEKIAVEKAGIIKPRRPVVTIQQMPAAYAIIESTACRQNAPLTVAAPVSFSADEFMRLQVRLEDDRVVPTRLAGQYQAENIGLALTAFARLAASADVCPEAKVADTTAQALREVTWPARMDLLRESPLFLVDGAHNPNGAARLAESLIQLQRNGHLQEAVLLTAALADKDAAALYRELLPYFCEVWCVPLGSSRALPVAQLAEMIHNLASAQKPADEVRRPRVHAAEDARAAARTLWEGARPVVVAGSLYLAGEVLAEIGEQSVFQKM